MIFVMTFYLFFVYSMGHMKISDKYNFEASLQLEGLFMGFITFKLCHLLITDHCFVI